MKPLDSAKTNFTIDKRGVFNLTIEHDIIRGVTPEMLLWWFQHIGGNMTYQGNTYPKYLVWHPKDHIYWSLAPQSMNKTVGAGSRFRIVEAFDRNMKYLVDSTELVTKLDATGIRLIKTIGSAVVFSLEHNFIPDGSNTIYKSRMMVGAHQPIAGTLFNTLIRPFLFPTPMATAWLKHNVEEVGNFEFFLPELFVTESLKL